MRPSVSIIVPVFNDEKRLEACLERLEVQTYPRDRFEVIVADNGSARNIRGLLSRFSRTRLIDEPKPGSYAARNAGLTVAAGEVVGFTDSDCLPRPDWIERGVDTLVCNPDLGMAGGRMLLFPRDPERLTTGEFYQEICGFPQQEYLEEKQYAVTANIFTWRKVLDDVGHFNSELRSSGDKEWGQRVHQAGYGQRYAEDVVVEHPSRRTLAQLAQKRMRTTGGRVQTLRIRGEAQPSLSKEARRLTRIRWDKLARFSSHPLMSSRRNRVRFLAIDQMMQLAELAEIVRLRLGGTPLRR